MYARLPAFVLGFHGCDRVVGEAILAGKRELHPSDNDYDWLGSGRYFWENSYERALAFAQEMRSLPRTHRRKHPITDPFVIGAIIDMGHCLNLLDHQGLELVKTQYHELETLFAESGQDLPQNTKGKKGSDLLFRHLDCAVIEAIHRQNEKDSHRPAYDSVRAVFVEGDALYGNAGFHGKNHIQLCVRNEACILGYFRPRPRQAAIGKIPKPTTRTAGFA